MIKIFSSFRVAAENDIGMSAPSKESFQTMTHRESKRSSTFFPSSSSSSRLPSRFILLSCEIVFTSQKLIMRKTTFTFSVWLFYECQDFYNFATKNLFLDHFYPVMVKWSNIRAILIRAYLIFVKFGHHRTN